jgi:hypothetical protein
MTTTVSSSEETRRHKPVFFRREERPDEQQRRQRSNGLMLLLIFLGAVCVLIQTFVTKSAIEKLPLRSSMTSNDRVDVMRYQGSSIAVFALVAPIVVDVLVDGVDAVAVLFDKRNLLRTKGSKNEQGEVLSVPEKALWVLGVIMLPATAFFPATMPNLAAAYCGIRLTSFCLIAGVFVASCHRHVGNFFPKWLCTIVYLLGLAGVMIQNGTNITTEDLSTTSDGMKALRTAGWIMVYAGESVFFLAALWWIVYVCVMRLDVMPCARPFVHRVVTSYPSCWSDAPVDAPVEADDPDVGDVETAFVGERNHAFPPSQQAYAALGSVGDELHYIRFRVIFIFILVFYSVAPIFLSGQTATARAANYTTKELLASNVPTMCFCLFYTVYMMFYVKFKAVSAFVSMIEVRLSGVFFE